MKTNVLEKIETAFDCLYEVLSEVNNPPDDSSEGLAVVLDFPKTPPKAPPYQSRQCFHLPIFKPEDEVD